MGKFNKNNNSNITSFPDLFGEKFIVRELSPKEAQRLEDKGIDDPYIYAFEVAKNFESPQKAQTNQIIETDELIANEKNAESKSKANDSIGENILNKLYEEDKYDGNYGNY